MVCILEAVFTNAIYEIVKFAKLLQPSKRVPHYEIQHYTSPQAARLAFLKSEQINKFKWEGLLYNKLKKMGTASVK